MPPTDEGPRVDSDDVGVWAATVETIPTPDTTARTMADSTGLDRAGRSPLHYAALQGDAGVVSRLISQGEDVGLPDRNGMTPLHFACQEGRLDIAKMLLAARAPVDARDSYGNPPLWRAVFAFKVGGVGLIKLFR